MIRISRTGRDSFEQDKKLSLTGRRSGGWRCRGSSRWILSPHWATSRSASWWTHCEVNVRR